MVFKKGHRINLGRKITKEHRRKLSEAKKGHAVSKETKRKISKGMKGRRNQKKL
tara:strand:- start:220 stop:381 length:162 start_codon:yes stop_codon:yes gene_type:complete